MSTIQPKDLVQLHDLTFEPFISATEIDQCVKKIANQLDQDFKDKEVVLVGVLKGAFVFLGELVKQMDIPLEVEFVRVSSYQGTSSTGEMQLSLDFPDTIAGKHVLIVEDIIDTGLTAQYLIARALSFDPASVSMVSLFLKPDAVKTDVKIDYVGMEIPDRFIVGYGLDYNEKGRELGDVYKLYKD